MDLCNKTIGFIFTGVFESFPNTISKIIELKKLNAKIIPIMSFNSSYILITHSSHPPYLIISDKTGQPGTDIRTIS